MFYSPCLIYSDSFFKNPFTFVFLLPTLELPTNIFLCNPTVESTEAIVSPNETRVDTGTAPAPPAGTPGCRAQTDWNPALPPAGWGGSSHSRSPLRPNLENREHWVNLIVNKHPNTSTA